jgi:hypothetical protein
MFDLEPEKVHIYLTMIERVLMKKLYIIVALINVI